MEQNVNPQAGYETPAEKPEKSKMVAGLMALLPVCLCCWILSGIHYFYIGKPKAALIVIGANLALGLISAPLWFFGVGFLMFPLQAILNLAVAAQGIYILMMSQEEFEEKFVNSDKLIPLY